MNETGQNLPQDEAVQDALMKAQDKLYALIRMLMIRNGQDALDVLQQTNAVILEHVEQHDSTKSVWAWFRSVAISQVKMYFRGKGRSRLTYDTDLMDTLSGYVEENHFFRGVELDEYLDAMKRCMGKLPPMRRELMQERYVDNVNVVDLAAKYHVTFRSLTQLFYRTRNALQECIRKTIQKRASRGEIAQGDGDGDFTARLELLLDDHLPQEKTEALEREIAQSPEKCTAYMQQAFLHAFIQCRKQNLFPGAKGNALPVFRAGARNAAIAAAVLALLATGAAVFLRRSAARPPQPAAAVVQPARPEMKPAAKVVPVSVLARIAPAAVPAPVSSPATEVVAGGVPSKPKEKAMKTQSAVKAVAVAAVAMAATASPGNVVVRQVRSTGVATVESSGIPLETRSKSSLEEQDGSALEARSRCMLEGVKGINLNTTKFRGLVVMLK